MARDVDPREPLRDANTRPNFKRYASLTTGSDYVNQIGLETVEMGMPRRRSDGSRSLPPDHRANPHEIRHHVIAGLHLQGRI